MSWEHPDPAEREDLHAEDLHVAELLGIYITRRETGEPPRLDELLTEAASFGPGARRKLATVAAFYDAAARPTH